MKKAWNERCAEIRKSGMGLIVKGIAIAIVSVLLLVGLAIFANRIFFILIAGVIWGIVEIFRGIGRLASGRAGGAVSDL